MLLLIKAKAIKEEFKSFEELGLEFSSFKDVLEEFRTYSEEENTLIKFLKKQLPLLKKHIPKEDEREDYEELLEKCETIVESGKEIKNLEDMVSLFEIIERILPKKPFSDIFNYCFENLTYEAILNFEIHTFLSTLFTEFENYLFQIFKFLILKKPKILDNKKVSMEELSLLSDLNKELINEMVAEKTLHDLFYYGYESTINYIKKNFNLNLNIPEKDLYLLMIYKQIRNIYAHRDGTANLLFLKKIKRYGRLINFHEYDDVQIGEKIKITEKSIKDLIQLARSICEIIDMAVLKRYPELKIPINIRLGKKNRKLFKKISEQFGIDKSLEKLKE